MRLMKYLYHTIMRRLHRRKSKYQTYTFEYHHKKRKDYKGLLLIAVVLFFLLQPSTKADFLSEEQQSIATSQKLLNATVKVEWGDIRTGGATGTGFYIAPNAIITAEHVIHRAPSLEVRLTRKDGTTCAGTIGYREEISPDLAIITTDCTGNPLTLATTAVEGQTVLASGNPSGYDFTVSKGMIGAMRSGYIQFDAKVNYGSSGGVLTNLSGEIVGVVVQKAPKDDYIGFAEPYSHVKLFMERSGIPWQ